MMMPKKKKKILIISSIVVCILIIIAVLVILYIKTDMFKSSDVLFAKYFKQNFDNINNLYSNLVENEYDNLLKESKYQSEAEIKINYAQNIGTTLENMQNPINQLKIEVEEQKDIANNYNYQDIQLIKDKEKVSEIKCILEDDVCGIQFADMFNQYVLANNENLKELLKETENFSDEQLSKIPNKIEFNYDLYDVFRFSEEEKENLSQRYTNIIINSVSSQKISKQSNQPIQINGASINANEYVMTLTKEELNNIYIQILEELKQDEIILNKVNNLQKFLNQYQFIFGEITDLQTRFVTEVQYLIDDIVQNNIGQEECKIIVYEQDGKTIKNVIQGSGYEISLETLASENYIKISHKNELEEKSLNLKKEMNQINISYQTKTEDKISEYNILINEEVNGNNCERIITAKYEDDTNRVEMNIEKNIQIVNKFDDEIILDSDNSVNLSDLELEQTKEITNMVNTAVSEKISQIKETIINEEDIKNVLVGAGLLKEEQVIVGTGVTETERNRFNSKFEILQGEELDDKAVMNLINAIKENLIGLEPVSANEIKLKLDQLNKNEEAFTTISNFIENNRNKKYSAKIEYDESTGLASDLLLTIEEKQ